MKDELSEKIMMQFVGLRARTYSYLIDDSSKDKKAKGTKKCVIKRKRKFETIKTVQKQFNLRIKYIIQKKKIKLTQVYFFVTKENIKNL